MAVKFLDGAFETYRRESNLSSLEIYKNYLKSGVDYLTVNGFNLVLEDSDSCIESINKECCLAKQAIIELNPKVTLLGSLGPSNVSLSLISIGPERVSKFGELVLLYKRVVSVYLLRGISHFIVETSQDSLNVKAALCACFSYFDSGCNIEVWVSCCPLKNGYLLDGTHFMSLHDTCLNYPFVTAFGFNCGDGPESFVDYLQELNSKAKLPILFYPNAGVPVNGRYASPESYANYLEFIRNGSIKVTYLGGCCGTTPEHIKLISSWRLSEFHNLHRERYRDSIWNRSRVIIGERLNANGSKKFLESALSMDLFTIGEIASDQFSKGTSFIDLNVDNPRLSNKTEVIYSVLNQCKKPICIDSSDSKLLFHFLRNAPNSVLLNSLAPCDENFVVKFKTAVSLGSKVIVRAQSLDLGFGDSLYEKHQIFDLVVSLLPAWSLGNIIYDICITPICLDEKSDLRIYEFYNLVRYIRSTHPEVSIGAGISNVSFAFKGNSEFRRIVNFAFTEFLNLDYIIANPDNFIERPKDCYKVRELLNKCIRGESVTSRLIELSQQYVSVKTKVSTSKVPTLVDFLLAGDVTRAKSLLGENPIDSIISAVSEIGKLYDSGSIQIVNLLIASSTSKKVLESISVKASTSLCRGILCTVRGDIHDIGKDILKEIITANGVEVTDLGIDVSLDQILDELNKSDYDFVGLSGLISPSIVEMDKIVRGIVSSYHKKLRIFVGGAVLYSDWATELNCDLNSDKIKVVYSKTPTEFLQKLFYEDS